jgi:hypothetical protein
VTALQYIAAKYRIQDDFGVVVWGADTGSRCGGFTMAVSSCTGVAGPGQPGAQARGHLATVNL